MKKIFYTALVLLALHLTWMPANAQDNVIDEIVWVVGDEAILKSDVEFTRLEMQMKGERLEGDPYCVIPEQIAIQKLFLHQAQLDSITISESELSRAVDAWINMAITQTGSKEKLEEYWKKPISQIREEKREVERDQEIIKQLQFKLIGDVRLTPSDIRKYYSKIPQDSLPFIPTTVEIEIVAIEPKISTTELDRVKNTLREYTDRVNRGDAEFSTLARLYSEDKASAIQGGELGLMGKAQLLPEFSSVAFTLSDPKKVSKIVETEYGFHIIQLVEKRGDRINVRHILIKPRVSESEIREATLKLDSIRTDIEAGKFSFGEAATYFSQDKETRNNKGLMVNSNGESFNAGTSRFEMAELPQEVGKIVNNMKVGEVSKPFTMLNSKQKEVVAIVRVKSRTEKHKANVSDDFLALKSIVENQKKQEIIDKWISEKQKNTYIRISENWKNCDFQRDGWISK